MVKINLNRIFLKINTNSKSVHINIYTSLVEPQKIALETNVSYSYIYIRTHRFNSANLNLVYRR